MSEKHIVVQEIEKRLLERLQDVNRHFERVCIVSGRDHLSSDRDGAYDLMVSHLGATFAENPPDYLFNAGKMLEPDGLFLASVLGADTFKELRDLDGAPTFAPLPDVRDVGAVLQKYGFALPVVDRDSLTLTFNTEARLIETLVACKFDALIGGVDWLKGGGLPRRADDKIPLTLDIVYLHGWFPAEGQPEPKQPGTATVPLSDVLS